MKFNVVIPSRYASSRLPGKPLLDIAGKPMVIWVVERAKASGAEQVVVATDDTRIQKVVLEYGYEVMMTKTTHQSGTDRIAEVAEALNWNKDVVVVNVQGDEPLISPQMISDVAQRLIRDQDAVMSTACFKIDNKDDFLNPNAVKVVMNAQQRALYFSRAPIPYPRDLNLAEAKDSDIVAHRHVGIYAYRAGFLKTYATLEPVGVESVESLEQLRVLFSGFQISVHVAKSQPETGVDTQEDLDKVRVLMRNNTAKSQ